MDSDNARITGMTMAITQMDEMVQFYQHVFRLVFEAVDMYGATLYKTQWNGLDVLFCPAALAQNTATQNRHQFNIEIEDLESILEQVSKHGGETMGEKENDGSSIRIGIKDPDNNSIVLIQKLEA